MQFKHVGLVSLMVATASSMILVDYNLVAISQPTQRLVNTINTSLAEAEKFIKQGDHQCDLGEYKLALRSYQQALNIYQTSNDLQGQVIAFGGLGNTYNALGDYKQAINYFTHSLTISNQISDINNQVIALDGLGYTYNALGQYKQAIDYLTKSLTIAYQIGDHNSEGNALNNLGSAYYLLGNYKKAVEYYTQSLTIARQIGDRDGEGTALNNLGNTDNSLGEYKQAIDYFTQSLIIKRQINERNGERKALIGLGNTYNSLRNYKKAIDYYTQSLTISHQIGDRNAEENALNNLGSADNSLGEYKKAIDDYRQSLAIARQIGDRNGEGTSLNNLGNVYKSTGKYKKAISYYLQSLSIAYQIGDRYVEGTTLNNLGAVLLSSGNAQQAEVNLEKAIQIWESLRADLRDLDALKISLFDTQANTYSLLQEALVKQHLTSQALEVAERGRTRALVELLIQRQKLSASPTPPNLQLIKNIARQENATLVEYSIVWNNLYIWVIKPTGDITFHTINLQKTNLDNLAKNTLAAAAVYAQGNSRASDLISKPVKNTGLVISQPSNNSSGLNRITKLKKSSCTANNCLRKMYNLLIQPIADELPQNPDSQIIFIPHESLFLVPFAALQDKNQRFLIEQHTISIAPSIQALEITHVQYLKLEKAHTFNSALVVGNPTMPEIGDPPTKLASLPESEIEAKSIAKLLNTQPLIGKQATKSAIEQKIARARIIHLATHSLLYNLDSSGIPGILALAPSGSDNGLLSANEVANLHLKANLVVLSACTTGRGRITGDGIIGLSRAFMTAGAPSIVVSLWNVNDVSTADLMTEFYQQLKRGHNKAVALRQAMLKTMKKYPNPSDWAAFVLVGEAS